MICFDLEFVKLQHEFMELACARAHRNFVKTPAHPNDVSERIVLESMKFEKKSLLPRLFTASLLQRDARLTKAEFIIVARQFVNLPQLNNMQGKIQTLPCGCQEQLCANPSCLKKTGPAPVLDTAGNHARICHPGIKAVKATTLERALEEQFRHAGGVPIRQPSTYALLGSVFYKPDLAKLFPANLTKEQAAERTKMAMEYLDYLRLPRGHIRTAKIGVWRDELPPAPSAQDHVNENTDHGVIRFDLRLTSAIPIGRPEELVIDHAIVHETSPTHAPAVVKYLESKRENQPGESPAFVKTRQQKSRHYACLVPVLERLSDDRKLGSKPTVLYPVISSLGYMNEDMNRVMKFILDRFKQNLHGQPPRLDGLAPKFLRGRFKAVLKNSVCFALVKGNALAMSNQGQWGVVRPV